MAAVGGIAIVLLAMILDRITQGLANQDKAGPTRGIRAALAQLLRPRNEEAGSFETNHQQV